MESTQLLVLVPLSLVYLHSHAHRHHNTIRSTPPSISLSPPSFQCSKHHLKTNFFILHPTMMVMMMMMMRTSSSCKTNTTFPSPLRSFSPIVKAPMHITPEQAGCSYSHSHPQETNTLLRTPNSGVENAANVFLEQYASMEQGSQWAGEEEEEEKKTR